MEQFSLFHIFALWCCSPTWAWAASLLRFWDHRL